VHLLAAVRAPTPAKKRIPRMRNNSAKPPPAEPVAVLKISPMGCPFATLSKVFTSGRINSSGMR
jgi:hypothetical protein